MVMKESIIILTAEIERTGALLFSHFDPLQMELCLGTDSEVNIIRSRLERAHWESAVDDSSDVFTKAANRIYQKMQAVL